jgi:hypothetical protein
MVRRTVLAATLSMFVASAAAKLSPEPKAIAQLVGDAFLAEAKPPVQNASSGRWECPMVNGRGCGVLQWGYGGALLFDGFYESIKQFGISGWTTQMDSYLDAYAHEKVYDGTKYVPGYDLAHNITRGFDSAVGDYIGLFPIAYLQRALSQGKTSGPDIDIALATANDYILKWPHRLADGTFSRTVPGDWPGETSTKVGSIVWGDDQTMGTVLIARLAPLFKNKDYAAEVTRQQIGFAKRLRDPADGLNYHGFNDKDGHDSCCKWGRANGWGMLGHAEALESMAAWPEGYPDAAANAQVKLIFQQHAAAAKSSQAADGRWHQLLNDTSSGSFLETSTTAMFLSAIVRGVKAGVLERSEYETVITKAWAGLASTVCPRPPGAVKRP